MTKRIIIIGGGPGGYVAAVRAAQLGASVRIIEEGKLGGTCLNEGCIPTKALYRIAEILHTLQHASKYGIKVEGYAYDLSEINERKQGIVDKLVSGIAGILDSYGIERIAGRGTLSGIRQVTVTDPAGAETELTADAILIATGSRPALPPVPGMDLPCVMTSREALEFTEIPDRLVIIGGGVIGMEFANIYHTFGTEVTVVEAMPHILSQVDRALAKRYQSIAKRSGINILTQTRAQRIEDSGGSATVAVEGRKGTALLETDRVLVSVGRRPNVENLNLDTLGIVCGRRGIEVNAHYETSIGGIYAVGDVNGINMLAHAASHQGITAVEHAMGAGDESGGSVVPACIFVSPEIAVVGMTEEQVKEAGIDYKTGRFMFGANGKAMTLGDEEGFVKVIAARNDDRILGVHILGPHASDLIHEAALAIQNGLGVQELRHTVHAHPTLSEALYEAVLGLDGIALHLVKPRR